MLYTFQVDRECQGGSTSLRPPSGLGSPAPAISSPLGRSEKPLSFPSGATAYCWCYATRGKGLHPSRSLSSLPSVGAVPLEPLSAASKPRRKSQGVRSTFPPFALTFAQRQTYPTLGQGDLSHSCDKSPYQFMQKTLSDTLRASRSVLNHSGVLFYPPQSPQNAYRRF